MKNIKIYIAGLVGLFALTSCEDVIELELAETDPRIIIEANINASESMAVATISESNGFYEAAEQLKLENAIVVLKSAGGEEMQMTLNENQDYEIQNLDVVSGTDYSIIVDIDGSTYTASTSIPYPSEIIALDTNRIEVPFGPGSEGENFQVFGEWQDPLEVRNYYRLKSYVNGVLEASSYALMSDNSVEGNYIKRPVQMPFEGGNEITLELLSCDKSYYDYFQQLASQQSQGLSSTSPFNPIGNFDNGALGYFGSFYSTSLDINL